MGQGEVFRSMSKPEAKEENGQASLRDSNTEKLKT